LNDGKRDMAKCPKCEKIVKNCPIEFALFGDGPVWKGIHVVCPYCKTILGSSIDPIAVKADIVREVLEGLGMKNK
jgi:hypothetical protein